MGQILIFSRLKLLVILMLFCRPAYVIHTDDTPSAKLWISTLDNINANTTDIKSEIIDLIDPSVVCDNFIAPNVTHLVKEFAIGGYILNQTIILCGCFLQSNLPNEWRCAVPIDVVNPGRHTLNSGVACKIHDRAVFLDDRSLLVISSEDKTVKRNNKNQTEKLSNYFFTTNKTI